MEDIFSINEKITIQTQSQDQLGQYILIQGFNKYYKVRGDKTQLALIIKNQDNLASFIKQLTITSLTYNRQQQILYLGFYENLNFEIHFMNGGLYKLDNDFVVKMCSNLQKKIASNNQIIMNKEIDKQIEQHKKIIQNLEKQKTEQFKVTIDNKPVQKPQTIDHIQITIQDKPIQQKPQIENNKPKQQKQQQPNIQIYTKEGVIDFGDFLKETHNTSDNYTVEELAHQLFPNNVIVIDEQ